MRSINTQSICMWNETFPKGLQNRVWKSCPSEAPTNFTDTATRVLNNVYYYVIIYTYHMCAGPLIGVQSKCTRLGMITTLKN